MYCSECGTVNPKHASYCLKCGQELGAKHGPAQSAVDIALAARPRDAAASSSANLLSRVVLLMLVGILVTVVPFMLLGQRLEKQPASRAIMPASDAAPSRDFESGLGLAPVSSSAAIARDVAKKTNGAKLRMALEQFYAENAYYPGALDQLDASAVGFAADPAIYLYQQTENGAGFILEIALESDNVSGADVVTEGDLTKLIIRND